MSNFVSGGKTCALKSFGVSAVMCKIGMPIPVGTAPLDYHSLRVDFFHNIFAEVGDQQSVSGGESTLMARLNACSEVIQKVNFTMEPFAERHIAG